VTAPQPPDGQPAAWNGQVDEMAMWTLANIGATQRLAFLAGQVEIMYQVGPQPARVVATAALDRAWGAAPDLRATSAAIRMRSQDVAEIDCGGGHGPGVIRAVQDALCAGKVPGTFVTDGRVTAVEAVAGSPMTDGNRPLPVMARPVDAPLLTSMLARYTNTFRWVAPKGKGGAAEPAEFSPEARLLSAALAPRAWPGLRPLNGIIGAPALRPDGTLLQAGGYDEPTGLYLASRADLPQVPGQLDQAALAWARDLVLRQVTGDFPWCGPADKANYLAMLITQIIRRRLRGSPVPFFPVTATDAASGKTLLATIAGVLFGKASITWTGSDEELRKVLTTVLASQEGVITFDNIPEGTVLRSGVLAKLLTDRTWGDRMLGGNVLGQFANDRLWVATGNNIRLGGDMGTRAVLISLDPAMPHPERRGGFAVGDLESWIEESANQRMLLIALLVLVADWAAAGCPEADVVPMRQFTRWARACGGFLAHHGVSGFLANAGELEDADDDSADWTQFLARWRERWGEGWVTSEQAAATAGEPAWGGTFPAGKDGALLGAKSLGRRLAGQKGRYHGTFVLKGWQDRTRLTWWHTEVWQEGR
jgi:hypothetical protein